MLVVAAAFLVFTGSPRSLYDNYVSHPGMALLPVLAVAALVGGEGVPWQGRALAAFLCSCATIVLVVATGLTGLFPNLIPSRLDPAASLTIANSSSGPYTLRLMAIVALVFVPIVVVYQLLVYRFFRARISREEAAGQREGY